MTPRTPLAEGCTGDIFCPIQGHVMSRWMFFRQEFHYTHVPLTVGQEKTRRERKLAAQTQNGDPDA